MSTTMDQVVKRAKDSFGQMFDKSLHDLVRGIRNHKDNEVKLLLFVCFFHSIFIFYLDKIY
jgi:hypothetical protein